LEENTIELSKKLSLIVLLLLLLPLLSGCLESSTNNGEDFVFTTVNGTVKHLSDYRGKVVIMDMWAIWCGPCQYQMLELEKVYVNYSRDDLEIISLNIDPRETSQQIIDFIEEFKNYGHELSWVFGNDDGSVWEEYQMPDGGIPTIYIFDQNGNVYYSEESYHPYSSLVEKIDELLD
jgi:thiol-disulfide isomerase/thioredoxin